MLPAPALSSSPLPRGFVYLRDIEPTIVQDIRYAGSHNFVGRPIRGYLAAECILSEPAAKALRAFVPMPKSGHFELFNEPFDGDGLDFEVSASPSSNETPAR